MNLFIPPELIDIEPDLKRFFDAMLYKLRKNANKGKWETYDFEKVQELMRKEIEELRIARDEGNSCEILLESADIANFAMIMAAIALATAGANRVP